MQDRSPSRTNPFSRRDLMRSAAALPALAGVASMAPAAMAATSATGAASDAIYTRIGVKPIINCRGTFTIIGGSIMLPESRAAMDAAGQHYVQLDELMDAIGARLAELTQAEWGMVSSGCAAGLTHATSACLAGGNPDLHVRIPNLAGFPKDEVVIPKHSRNVYDAAVRATGVRVIEAETAEEFERALGPRVAMVYVLAGPQAERGPLAFPNLARMAAAKNVPVLVDAAAEVLTIPNAHLTRGATLVAYSGGKCIRGPQTAGLLLGRKDLVRAAWVESAPHHGFARSMKVGKEEAMGMLAAVEMWVRRDHKAEWNNWLARLDHISKRVTAVNGVTTHVLEPNELSNHTPELVIEWDRAQVGITGPQLSKVLFDTDPRIAVPARGGRNSDGKTGIGVVPYMMQPGDERVVAERLYTLLSTPPKMPSEEMRKPAADVTGRWDVRIDYLASSSNHVVYLKQDGNQLTGTHQGDFVARDLAGSISGPDVSFTSAYTERHGDSLMFHFTGALEGDTMAGALDMGEYRGAKWTAKRHHPTMRG